jgi:hypothetical protein
VDAPSGQVDIGAIRREFRSMPAVNGVVEQILEGIRSRRSMSHSVWGTANQMEAAVRPQRPFGVA